MFALLGTIQFEVVTSPNDTNQTWSADFSEHARYTRKPRLQFTGDKLDELHWNIHLNARFCDPDAQLDLLKSVLTDHKPLTLVLGNGRYVGRYVLWQMAVSTVASFADGTTMDVTATVDLREFVGDDNDRPPAPAVVKPGAKPPLAIKKPEMAAPTLLQQLGSAVQKASNAISAVRNAAGVLNSIRTLAQQSPMAVLTRLPGIASDLQSAAGGLGVSLGNLNGLSQVGAIAADMQTTVNGLTQARQQISAVVGGLRSAKAGGLVAAVGGAASTVGGVAGSLSALDQPLARLAAFVGTRRGG